MAHKLEEVGALVFLVLLVSSIGSCSSSNEEEDSAGAPGLWRLTAGPNNSLERIIEKVPYYLNLTLSYNGTDTSKYETPGTQFIVRISMDNPWTLSLNSSQIEFTWEDVKEENSKKLEVIGQVIGYVNLNFTLEILADNTETLQSHAVLEKFLVTVVRQDNTLDNIFTIVMLVMAVFNTVNMGCGLDLQVVKANILRPVGPIVGFVSQFTFMPLFSFGLAMLFIDDKLKGFGLLVMGVCPGGLASNFWTLLLDGDVNLSITMTFVSSIAAMGMMPLWLWLLSDNFLPPGSRVEVPFTDMVVSLILLTVPLGIGLLIRRCKPGVAHFLSVKIIKPFSFFWIIFVFGFGFYSMSHIFILLDWVLLGAGLSVTVAGFIFGGLFAWVARLNRAQIIAVSLETAMQNANIAFVLLKTSLPDPYSDIAALPPIAQIIMTSSLLFVLYFIILGYRCCTKGNEKKEKRNISNEETEQETEKMLTMKEHSQVKETYGGPRNDNRLETPPPQYHGGEVTPEFSWTKNPTLIIPNSPMSDRTNSWQS